MSRYPAAERKGVKMKSNGGKMESGQKGRETEESEPFFFLNLN